MNHVVRKRRIYNFLHVFVLYGRIAPVGYGLYGKLLNGRYNGKLPVVQTRVVIEKGGGEEGPIQWKVTGASDARGNRKGGREERPIQWKVTGASDARGNRKGGREERPIQWKVTGASDARGNRKGG